MVALWEGGVNRMNPTKDQSLALLPGVGQVAMLRETDPGMDWYVL